jgi:hypothetical protein
MAKQKPKMTTWVDSEGTYWLVEYYIDGGFIHATTTDPEEWPEVVIVSVTSEDGVVGAHCDEMVESIMDTYFFPEEVDECD